MDIRSSENTEKDDLCILCKRVKELVLAGKLRECEHLVFDAMRNHPDAAEPHNLYGIILERKGEHLVAMKHFRAAWVLNPMYRPAKVNLERYGCFAMNGEDAFDENDCSKELNSNLYDVQYDEDGIGYVLRKKLKIF